MEGVSDMNGNILVRSDEDAQVASTGVAANEVVGHPGAVLRVDGGITNVEVIA